jgi:tetratricopeptide (TPR) repeat protein
VEVDLLLNYGLREKALSLLLNLEAENPCDREVRIRLLSLYKAEKKYAEAAEQCLLLAALSRRAKNEESVQSYLAEASQLAPEVAASQTDLEAFARRKGITAESPVPSSAGDKPAAEVDLSADLLDIFFAGDSESAAGEDIEPQPVQEVIPDGYAQAISPQAPSRSMPEQLQEVDFYIRLGFHDEALTKLNEIARINPDNPDLTSRYQKLGEIGPTAGRKPADTTPPDAADFEQIDDALDRFVESHPEEIRAKPSEDSASAPKAFAAPPMESAQPDLHANDMFADLLEEVGAPADQEAANASFEDHFSLGTAYRDMDLIEEAIREFQSALKAVDRQNGDRRIIQCCGMLSTCFLKKSMPRSALRWCQTGLSVADISSHEAIALRYDMGVAHSMAGSNERALECFDQIFSVDPSYRDVAERIDALKGGFERHAP